MNVVGPPLTAAVWAPLPVQEMVNHGSVTFTASLKVMAMSEARATLVASSAGVVAVTVGAISVRLTVSNVKT